MTVPFNEFDSVLRDALEKHHITELGYLPSPTLTVIRPHLMPENIKTCAVWVIPYYTGAHENRNISLYSVSKDYHLFSRSLGMTLVSTLESRYPDERFYSFCDSSPISDIKAAYDAGLGYRGKNHLLIHPTYGSYLFIGCLLTTLEVSSLPDASPLGDCISCGKCFSACGYLRGESEVCLSELNQRKALTDEELETVKAAKIRWGCDICQEVCPMNAGVPETPIPFFYEDQIEVLTAALLETMPKDDFRKRAFAWRGKKTIARNI